MSKEYNQAARPSAEVQISQGLGKRTTRARLRSLLAELVSSCPDYTGKLEYKDRGNLFLRGAMCDFFRCALPVEEGQDPKFVVVKRRRLCDYHEIPLPSCFEELLLWDSLNGHENILPLIGYIYNSEGTIHCPSLIADWTPNGTVTEYLSNNPNTDILPLCHGVARGLAFMHEKGMIHGNVKGSNVLIGADGRALLSGFTLSVWPNLQAKISGISMDSDKDSEDVNIFSGSFRADVWAYGMTIMTIIQRFPAFSELTSKKHVVDAVLNGKSVAEAESHPKYGGLWIVCQACCHPDTINQPMMATVIEAFDNADLRSLNTFAVTSRLRRTLQHFRKVDLSGKIVQLEAYNRNHGGFSDVYFGQSTVHDKLVAIKRVRYRLHDDLLFLKRMVRELQIWASLDHKNVLPLLGYTTDGGLFYLSLITEWMSNGTVVQYVKSKGEKSVDLLYMVKGIAAGLAYLHTQNIVHSDMKAGNVLISPEGEPLVTDFGISHMLSSSSIVSLTTGTHGTTRWMAYEQINVETEQTSTPYTFKTDVWSFGMTILELLTLEVPYAHLLLDQQVVITIYKKGLPPRPDAYSQWSEEYKQMWAMCKSCWDFDPRSRPSMDVIMDELNGI